jgi:primosomal protein N' (replication factor Y)
MPPPTLKISPLKRMPFHRHYFDYAVPLELIGQIQVGQLVKIPLRNHEEFGIVIEINSHPSSKISADKIKPITSLVFSEPIILPQQLLFLKELSEMYFVSFNFLLKTSLLPLQKTKLKKITITTPHKLNNDVYQNPLCYYYITLNEHLSYLKKHLDKNGQNLILVPEINQIDIYQKQLKNKNLYILSGDISDKDFFDLWIEIRNNPLATIIGTRKAIFLPWTNLKNIFLVDEGNPNHKSWDMAPRIHARDAVLSLSKYYKAQLHLTSHSPSVETYFFSKNKIYQTSHTSISRLKNTPWIVDISQEKKNNNYSPISEIILKEITKSNQGDIFLYLNKKGTASGSLCLSCGHTEKCPECQKILVYFEDTQTMKCPWCEWETKTKTYCTKCQSQNMVFVGAGIGGIKKILKQRFEEKFEIIMVEKGEKDTKGSFDSTTVPLRMTQRKGGAMDEKRKIFVGTEYALGQLNWKNISLIAALDTDSSLYIPEYKMAENLWQMIRSLQFTAEPHCKIFLQTHNPEHPVLAFLTEPDKFYNSQLSERKIFDYPPFNFILKMFYNNPDKKFAKTEALKQYNQLLLLTKTQKNVKISGPFQAQNNRQKGQNSQIILIKSSYANYKTIIKEINHNLTEEWKVDPNPNNLLSA